MKSELLKKIIVEGDWNFIDEEIIWKALNYMPEDEDAAKILAYADSLNLPGGMKCSVYKNHDDNDKYILFEDSRNWYMPDTDFELIKTYHGHTEDILNYIEIVSDWDRAASDEELEIVDCLDPQCPEKWEQYQKEWENKAGVFFEGDEEYQKDLESRKNLMRHIIRALLIKDFINEI